MSWCKIAMPQNGFIYACGLLASSFVIVLYNMLECGTCVVA